MRVYFDEYRPDGEGGFEQAGGFWLAVNVWRASLAENCSQHLRKGARVSVTGRLDMQTWTDKEGEERNELRLIAEDVTLALGRIESVRMRPKRGADDAAREAEEGLEQAA
jgi:single-strand DNA-binding protein